MRIAAVFALVSASVLLASPARSAPDSTPPVLHAPAKASFAVGQQLEATVPPCYPPDPANLWVNVGETIGWSADDGSPVTYAMTQETGDEGVVDVWPGQSAQTSLDAFGTNSSQACGGGNHSVSEWVLTATDSAGNSSTATIHGGRLLLTQDGGRSDPTGYPVSRPTLAYQGGWSVARCSCWMGGQVHKTAQRGASALLTFSHVDGQPLHVGLVMHTGPSRGSFKVLLDGRRVGTVDTHAAQDRARVLVWQHALPDSGHTLRLVSLGTGRIDLDAVVTN